MKIINKYLIATTLILGVFLLWSCEDEIRVSNLDFPNDVTFNPGEGLSVDVPYLTFVVPTTSFKAKAYKTGEVTFNVKKNADGTHTGFALSSKNYRSYPWSTSKPLGSNPSPAKIKEAVDSSIYSVYSGRFPNQLKTFTVVRPQGDDAFFTVDKPRVVEHVLVANTTYNYMLLNYGSRYSSKYNKTTQLYEEMDGGNLAKVRNPNIPDASSAKFAVWYLPDPYGFGKGSDFRSLAGQQALAGTPKGYFKITAKGYLNGQLTATSDYYLAVLEGVAPAPYDKWNLVQSEWAKWDLSTLGAVDKVIFYLDSSDKDVNGEMRTPPYFCLDGIRLK